MEPVNSESNLRRIKLMPDSDLQAQVHDSALALVEAERKFYELRESHRLLENEWLARKREAQADEARAQRKTQAQAARVQALGKRRDAAYTFIGSLGKSVDGKSLSPERGHHFCKRCLVQFFTFVEFTQHEATCEPRTIPSRAASTARTAQARRTARADASF